MGRQSQDIPSFDLGPSAENIAQDLEFSDAELLLWPPAPILAFAYFHISPSFPRVAGTARGRQPCTCQRHLCCPLLTLERELTAAPHFRKVQPPPSPSQKNGPVGNLSPPGRTLTCGSRRSRADSSLCQPPSPDLSCFQCTLGALIPPREGGQQAFPGSLAAPSGEKQDSSNHCRLPQLALFWKEPRGKLRPESHHLTRLFQQDPSFSPRKCPDSGPA